MAKGNEPISKTNGILSHVFDHYKALPLFYDFENMPIEELTDKISRQYIYSGQSMLVKWILKKGAEIPLHHHVNEQITWITAGSVIVYSQGKEFLIKAGEVIIFPPHVPHEFFAVEDTIDIDFFTPVREDWINQSASYLQKVSK
jgi:quercetin dioxygenase-like cupin family protein